MYVLPQQMQEGVSRKAETEAAGRHIDRRGRGKKEWDRAYLLVLLSGLPSLPR